jgi:hypothetical protein
MNEGHVMSERTLLKEDGYQKVWQFPNGYGASVVSGPYTYGGEQGLFELAVLRFDDSGYTLTYDTPITSDVLGHLTPEDVATTLDAIEALPKP